MNNDYGDFLKTKEIERLEKIATEVLKSIVISSDNTTCKFNLVADSISLAKELIRQLNEERLK